MTFPEISLLVCAAVPVLYRAWSGWHYGATVEFRYMLTFLFATLVAARYWQPCTETLVGAVTFDPRLVAVVAFLALFVAGAVVAGLVVDMRAKFYKSVKANYVDSVLGLFGGLFSGALLAACILWVAAIAMPGKFSTLPQVQSLIELPRDVIASLETAAGVAPGSTGRTKYPVVSMVDVQIEDASGTLAAGSVLMQRRGRIDWK